MAKLKYNLFICKECEIDFITQYGDHCTFCGDNVYSEKQRVLWLERPFLYKRPWTNDDDSLLITSVELGIKNQDIADELGRTKDAVAERLRRLRKIRVIERGINK